MTELEELLIERACLRLMVDYNLSLDAADFDGFTAVFTTDAVWKQITDPVIEVTGHRGIRKVAENLPSAKIRRHLLQNPRVTVIGPDQATGICLGLVIDGPARPGPLPVPVSPGGVELVAEYRDWFRKGPDGWRIERREMTRILDQKAIAVVADPQTP